MNMSKLKSQASTHLDIVITIFAAVIILAVVLFYCINKSGYYEDEIASYGLANSHYAAWLWEVDNKYQNFDMTESMIDSDYIRNYLEVDESQRFDFGSVYANQIEDVHPPLYYFFLHFMSSLNPNTLSTWQGLVPNIVFFILTLITLFFCITRLGVNKAVAAVGTTLFALSSAGLSNMLFIRMYCLQMLMTTILLYLIIRFVSSMDKNNYVLYPLILITVALGVLTQYTFIYIAFSMCLVTVIFLLSQKMYKKLLLFGFSGLGGVFLALCIFPYFFEQIQRGANFGLVSAKSVFSRVLAFESYLDNFSDSIGFFVEELPVLHWLIIILIVSIVVGVLLNGRKKYSETSAIENKEQVKVFIVVVMSFLLSFMLLVLTNPVNVSRYFYPIMPFLSIFASVLISVLFRVCHFKQTLQAGLTFLSFVLLVVLSLVFLDPDYVYGERKGYASSLSGYEHSPTLYVAGGYRSVSYEALPYLALSDDTLIILNKGDTCSDLTNDYVTKHSNNGSMLIYISESASDPEVVASGFADAYSYSNVDHAFDCDRFSTYILRK